MAARAAVLITPFFSAWSDMLRPLMHAAPTEYPTRTEHARAGRAKARGFTIMLCCSCSARERAHRVGNVVAIVAGGTLETREHAPLRRALRDRAQWAGCSLPLPTQEASQNAESR